MEQPKLKVAKCCGNCKENKKPNLNLWECEKQDRLVHIYNVCKLHEFQEITVICADKNDEKRTN